LTLKTSHDFLLVDNIQKLDDLGDYKSKLIITFDYSSHVFLSEQKIPHTISDEYNSIKELKIIEKLIYSFGYWYDLPSLKNDIFENNINLGELFFSEFNNELVPLLKKFFEISKIIKLNPISHYFVSENIFEIISIFTSNITKIKMRNQTISLHNSIDVPLKFGSKQITLKLSTKNISRIQKLLNIFGRYLFFNKKIVLDFSNILLVNFTTLKSKELLLEIPNFDLNVIKYDRTIPSVWNKHSFDIIKNSNCIIENETTLLDKKISKRIKQNKNTFLSKIDLIFLNKNLEKYFSFDEMDFWCVVKPLLIKLCKKRFVQAAEEIEFATKLLEKYSFSKILLLNESSMVEKIIIKLAKQKKIDVCVLQHGLFYDSKEMIPKNLFERTIPKNPDYYFAWGEISKNYLISNEIDPNKIKVTGSLFFDNIFQNKIPTYTDTNCILLASDPLAFNRPIDLSIVQKEKYENTIEEVCKIVSKNKKNLIIKTHPQKNQNESKIAKKINSSIKIFHSGDIHPLIQSSDLVITTDLSTVILEAMIMQKPVISIRLKEHYGMPDILKNCTQISLDSLDSWLVSFYTDPTIKKNLIAKGNEYLNSYFSNQGKSAKSILEFL